MKLQINQVVTVWDKPKNSKSFNSSTKGTILDIIGNIFKIQLENGYIVFEKSNKITI